MDDHYNCREKFGKKRGPMSCIKTEGFEIDYEAFEINIFMDQFEYTLKHKYSCLRRFTQLELDPDVQWCFEKTANYLIQTCLKQYEERVKVVDFTLMPGVAEGNEHYDESEVFSYGAK